jgi:hypothetical protein
MLKITKIKLPEIILLKTIHLSFGPFQDFAKSVFADFTIRFSDVNSPFFGTGI